jgi:hypothetical protein
MYIARKHIYSPSIHCLFDHILLEKIGTLYCTLEHYYDVILCSLYAFHFLKRQGQSNKLPVAVQ